MESAAAPPPTGLVGSAAFLLVAAGRTVQRRLEEALTQHGLTLRHVGALGHLARNPELSYSDLGRRAGVTAQSMHATVNRLEQLGAVDRRSAGRGLAAQLVVTQRGRDLLARAAEIARALDTELVGSLDRDRRDELLRLLIDVAAPPRRGDGGA